MPHNDAVMSRAGDWEGRWHLVFMKLLIYCPEIKVLCSLYQVTHLCSLALDTSGL